MDARELRAKQAPLKARFREQPEAARITLKATGRIDEDVPFSQFDSGKAGQ